MSPIEALYKEFKSELLAELKHSIMEELKPELNNLIKQAAQEIKIEEEYQLVDWFLKKYPISKKTFHKYKNLGYVDTKQVGRFKMYNVKHWIKNLDKVKSGVPDYLKVSLGKVS